MSVATTYEHITLNDSGVAYIENTTTKVIELVVETKAYGWSPEEIRYQHPYLSLGQIYSAFAYYWDNAERLDREIKERYENVQRIRAHTESFEIRNKLEEKGLLKCR